MAAVQVDGDLWNFGMETPPDNYAVGKTKTG